MKKMDGRFYDTRLIASRANGAQNNTFGKFYKTYVKNVRIIRAEQTTPFHTELDFEFEYKGKIYVLTEKVNGSFTCAGTYSIYRAA